MAKHGLFDVIILIKILLKKPAHLSSGGVMKLVALYHARLNWDFRWWPLVPIFMQAFLGLHWCFSSNLRMCWKRLVYVTNIYTAVGHTVPSALFKHDSWCLGWGHPLLFMQIFDPGLQRVFQWLKYLWEVVLNAQHSQCCFLAVACAFTSRLWI